LIEEVAGHFGRLDIQINSAPEFSAGEIRRDNTRIFECLLDTNLRAPFLCAQAAAPYLAKSGKGIIINFADSADCLAGTYFCRAVFQRVGNMKALGLIFGELSSFWNNRFHVLGH